MDLELSLSVEKEDSGDILFNAELHNVGDETVQFSTATGKAFSVSLKDDQGNPISRGGSMTTMAVEHWTVEPGDTLFGRAAWESREAIRRVVEEDLEQEFDAEEYPMEFPEDYDEVVVEVEVASTADAVEDLSLTEQVEVP